jgi:hypothetical protein
MVEAAAFADEPWAVSASQDIPQDLAGTQHQSPSCLFSSSIRVALLTQAVLCCGVLLQVLLGVIIDSVFPQSESPAACARGALAKHIVEQQAEQVQASLLDPNAEITVPGPTAGAGQTHMGNG